MLKMFDASAVVKPVNVSGPKWAITDGHWLLMLSRSIYERDPSIRTQLKPTDVWVRIPKARDVQRVAKRIIGEAEKQTGDRSLRMKVNYLLGLAGDEPKEGLLTSEERPTKIRGLLFDSRLLHFGLLGFRLDEMAEVLTWRKDEEGGALILRGSRATSIIMGLRETAHYESIRIIGENQR